jgi:hypothetical protein
VNTAGKNPTATVIVLVLALLGLLISIEGEGHPGIRQGGVASNSVAGRSHDSLLASVPGGARVLSALG